MLIANRARPLLRLALKPVTVLYSRGLRWTKYGPNVWSLVVRKDVNQRGCTLGCLHPSFVQLYSLRALSRILEQNVYAQLWRSKL